MGTDRHLSPHIRESFSGKVESPKVAKAQLLGSDEGRLICEIKI